MGVLNVQRCKEAKEAGAKKAYRKLTLQYHPDKHQQDKDKFEAIFKVLSNAWERYKTSHRITGGDE